jgi:hypothetical protein
MELTRMKTALAVVDTRSSSLGELKSPANIEMRLRNCLRLARKGSKSGAAPALVQTGFAFKDSKPFANESRTSFGEESRLFASAGNLESAGSALLSTGLIAKQQRDASAAKISFSAAGALFERAPRQQ